VRELNPDVSIRAIHGNVLTDVGLGLVREMDVVIACLDNREARLWVNRMCWKVTRPWIDGGIQEINGVAKVFQPPDGACYECSMTDADYRLIQLRYSCPLLRREDMQEGKVPTAPTVASIIGGLQVQEALKLLHHLEVESGAALVFNGVANRFYTTRFQHREDCLSHETWDPVIESPLDANCSLLDVQQWLRNEHGLAVDALLLDRDLVTELHCDSCNSGQTVLRPRPALSAAEAICPNCGEPMAPQMQHVVDVDSALAEMPLRRLGVPDREILHLAASDGAVWLELASATAPE
jgi:adenylyltransferase/sulfurtransferase